MTTEQNRAETHTVLLIWILAVLLTAFAITNILIYNNYYRNSLNINHKIKTK